MKSKERHDLHHNALLDLLKNPRELTRRYGLPALVLVLAGAVAIWLIVRAGGAEERKSQRSWLPLQTAVATHNEELLRDITADDKAIALVRAWANIKRGELLYKKSQQQDYSQDEAAREELLDQAISCYQQAMQISPEHRDVLGQATIGMGLCYEDLGQFNQARRQYEDIISQAKDRFEGTVWLAKARNRLDKDQNRKSSLEYLANEKVVFKP